MECALHQCFHISLKATTSRPRGAVGIAALLCLVADRLLVLVRFLAGPRARIKTVDSLKGNGLGQKKQPEGHH